MSTVRRIPVLLPENYGHSDDADVGGGAKNSTPLPYCSHLWHRELSEVLPIAPCGAQMLTIMMAMAVAGRDEMCRQMIACPASESQIVYTFQPGVSYSKEIIYAHPVHRKIRRGKSFETRTATRMGKEGSKLRFAGEQIIKIQHEASPPTDRSYSRTRTKVGNPISSFGPPGENAMSEVYAFLKAKQIHEGAEYDVPDPRL